MSFNIDHIQSQAARFRAATPQPSLAVTAASTAVSLALDTVSKVFETATQAGNYVWGMLSSRSPSPIETTQIDLENSISEVEKTAKAIKDLLEIRPDLKQYVSGGYSLHRPVPGSIEDNIEFLMRN